MIIANEDLSRLLKMISSGAWWYEEPGGMMVICEIRDDEGVYLRTDHIKIPWRRVREAVQRKDK